MSQVKGVPLSTIFPTSFKYLPIVCLFSSQLEASLVGSDAIHLNIDNCNPKRRNIIPFFFCFDFVFPRAPVFLQSQGLNCRLFYATTGNTFKLSTAILRRLSKLGYFTYLKPKIEQNKKKQCCLFILSTSSKTRVLTEIIFRGFCQLNGQLRIKSS